MLKNKSTILFASIFLVQNFALAETNQPILQKQHDTLPPKYHAYLGVGISSMSLDNELSRESFKATGITLQAGYDFNDYIAIEGRYTKDLGKVKYNHGKTDNPNYSDYPGDFSNAAIYVKPMYSLYDFSLYALLGYGTVKLTNIPNVGTSADRSEEGFEWGVGFTYDLTKSTSLYFDYVNAYKGKGFDYRAQDADITSELWTFGISYMF